MSRAAPPLPISPKVFKHFATVTIAITVCVAVFADGEGREMVTEQVAAVEAQNRVLKAEAEKLGARHLGAGKLRVRAEGRPYLDFAPDTPAQAETPIDNYVGSKGGNRPNTINASCARGPQPQAPGAARRCQGPAAPGSAGTSQPGGPPQGNGPSQAQIDRMLEASRIRSGGVE